MKNTKKVLFLVTVALLVIAFGVSAFMVIKYMVDGKRQEDRYDDLQSIVSQNTTAGTEAASKPTEATTQPTQSEATEPTMIPGYAEIYAQNPHTVGWLKIEGTKLNYPVLQSPDQPNFYLDHDFDGKPSKGGAIYAREECDINKPSDNITLYGHNMANGSMFATLNNYTSKDYWEKNKLIFFDTLYEFHTYKIFAVFKTSANLGEGFSYHQLEDAANQQEFDDFVSTCKKLSFYDTGITPKYGDKLICLSTCEYTLDNGRLVVAAVRIT